MEYNKVNDLINEDTEGLKGKEVAMIVGGGVLASVAIKATCFSMVVVPTGSMLPTIQLNDTIFCTPVHSNTEINRGEILVFKSDERKKDMIKRVIGLPGETVTFDQGKVFINGKELKEDYVNFQENRNGTFVVPENSYFFCGDNRANSSDSFYWNKPYINKNKIKSKGKYVVYPLSRSGLLH